MTLRYAIRPGNPGAHLFHVTLALDRPDSLGQRFMLPTWIPGSYMIREFARHVVRITALAGKRSVAIRKLDKHTWQAAPFADVVETLSDMNRDKHGDKQRDGDGDQLTLAYEIYAWDLSVRAAHLDPTHGFFNGASVFLLPLGREDETCVIDVLPPAGARFRNWRVATGLAPAQTRAKVSVPARRAAAAGAGEFGTFRATNYDELIDCPVEMGTFAHARFDVLGVPHEIAITGRVPKLDLARLTNDLTRICATQIRLFEPRTQRAPFAHYSFLTLAVDEGFGGLEHRNSTALMTRRDHLPSIGMRDSTEGYRSFLGLASHEYFHSWNVKRIKPAAFVPYDLARENYTRLLWLFEGFTSYYDDLLLARCGLLSQAQYLETLGKTLTSVMQRSSRLKQSIAESSFDAWIKFYRQDENAANSVVSYYQKGSLVALALDLTIRSASRGRRSLDDVMRTLWRQWQDAGDSYAGVADNAIAAIVKTALGVTAVSGAAIARKLRDWTEGTRDPDYAGLLAPFGVLAEQRAAVDSLPFALLGVKLASDKIAEVHDGSPAQIAGLSAGDTLVAIEGLRATGATIDRLLARHTPGETVEVTAFRRDELMRFTVKLAARPPEKYLVLADPKADAVARRRRQSWLG